MNKENNKLIKNTTSLVRKVYITLSSMFFILFYLSPKSLNVFAEETGTGGGNHVTESSVFKGLLNMCKDCTFALACATPIICGLLIGLFSLLAGINSEEHDQLKWKKCRKVTIHVLIWVFSSSAIVTIITSYVSPKVA